MSKPLPQSQGQPNATITRSRSVAKAPLRLGSLDRRLLQRRHGGHAGRAAGASDGRVRLPGVLHVQARFPSGGLPRDDPGRDGRAAPGPGFACVSGQARLLYTRRHGVPITIVRLDSTRKGEQSLEEVRTVLDLFRTYLEVYRPDVMLTYGGDPVTQGMIALAKGRGIPIVFVIHNFTYTGFAAFGGVDCCVAPSEFACRCYRDRLGLACRALPDPVDWDRVRAKQRAPAVRDVRQPAAGEGCLPVCPDCPRVGPAPAGYPAAGGREPRHARHARRLRARARRGSPRPDHAQHARPAAILILHPGRALALAVVGDPANGGHRDDDQQHSGHRFRPRLKGRQRPQSRPG